MFSKLWFNLRQSIRQAIDRWVDFLSGRTPAPGLAGPSAFGAAFLIGVVALGLGTWIILSSIQRAGQPVALGNGNVNQVELVAELRALQSKDTDEDGLSDYDELYRLKTSPYLSDSDSDGLSDGDEAAANTDANCPAGQTCTGVIVQPVTSDQEQLSPAFLRQALRASGVAQSVLDGLVDEQLLAIYQQILQQGTTGNINATPTLNSLEGLTGPEIRELLISAGVSQSEISQYDDATLKKVFEDAIQNESSN